MNFKTTMILGLLLGGLIFTSCRDTPSADEPTEMKVLTDMEEMAFQEEVNKEEERLEDYIKEINAKIDAAEEEGSEALKAEKTTAVKMLLELRADYNQLTQETAAKWVVFQEGVNNLIPSAEEEINYAQDLDDDDLDS